MSTNRLTDEQSFSAMSDQELVDAYNRQVGNHGWGSARANYMYYLRRELERRDPKSRAEAEARMLEGCVCGFCRRQQKVLANLPMEREVQWEYEDTFYAHGMGVSLA